VKRWNQTFRAVEARWRPPNRINRRLPVPRSSPPCWRHSNEPPTPWRKPWRGCPPGAATHPLSDYFIQQLEEYFAEPTNAHLLAEVKVRVVYKQLRGPVFKRYKAFASRGREFRAVKDRLVTHNGVERTSLRSMRRFKRARWKSARTLKCFVRGKRRSTTDYFLVHPSRVSSPSW
jgi:hypothetical protein